MAQRDPLVEYQREGFQLFEAMNDAIKEESVGYLFNAEVEVPSVPESSTAPMTIDEMLGGGAEDSSAVDRPTIRAKGLEEEPQKQRLHYSAPSETGGVEERVEGDEAPRASRAQRRAAKKSKKA